MRGEGGITRVGNVCLYLTLPSGDCVVPEKTPEHSCHGENLGWHPAPCGSFQFALWQRFDQFLFETTVYIFLTC